MLIVENVYGQKQEEKNYVVLTFEMDRNKDMHGTYVYYWIAEIDTANQKDELEFHPLFLHSFTSSDQVETCCSGKPSLIFALTTESKFDYRVGYLDDLEELRKLVKMNRKNIQTIKKSWPNNYKEEVRVYATPITGSLCECEMIDEWTNTYKGKVFMPEEAFRINSTFWAKGNNSIIGKDFSGFEYINSDYRTNK